MFVENPGFTLNADNSIIRLIPLAPGFVVAGGAILFHWTMRRRRAGGRFFQESWPVRFEGFPASTHAQSNWEEDEAWIAAPGFAKFERSRGVADSARTAHSRG